MPNKLKYWFWRLYTPLHPLLRDTTTTIGIVRHKRRQNFLVGMLHPERPMQDFALFLVEQGFGNHFVAWKDPNEILSLRRIHGFNYQYHIRVFSDREIRCHYEYTPEYRPLHHMLEIGFEPRTKEFLEILGDWATPVPTASTHAKL